MANSRARKLVLPVAALSVSLLGLTACGSGGSDSAGTSGDADCSAYESYGTFDGAEVSVYSTIVDLEAELLENSWADFSECTGIDVAYEGSKEFETQIGVRAQGGTAPDLAIFPQPGLLADQASNLVPAPQAVSDLVDENWSEDWKNYGTVDGTFYAAPMLANVKGYVWYVPATFEEKGWEVPTTWDEMMELSGTIASEGEMKPWCAGFESGEATGWPGTDWVEDAVLREHGPEVYDQWVAHEIPFDDPMIVDSFDRVGEILKDDTMVNGGFGDVRSILSTPFSEAGQPVLDGSCAMHHQASFQAANWPEGTEVAEDGDVWAFMTPPIDESQGTAITGGGELIGAYADRPEVEALQTYLASAEFANARVSQGGAISANKGLDPANAQSDLDRQSIELLQDPETVFRFDGSDLMPGAVGANSFWSGIVNWINGSSTEEVTKSVEDSWPSS
ncbi:carbohydrate ABC transporter substrate-binding protein [Arthrobacter agilis]|uniref:ABC transporter substrate-binding protein n=1 Tax=Arthrobacter agilis TaxID=37921 RepID=UPI000B35164F|nr:ABC transporter substrate-binding protein [Arthrobacter agilis]OUM43610.1 sugar ABC transporter substrate-binding protein [Arthrobacter agilis]PPB46803.1 carbohydrate ABC transporter substrate-binding protein [Arthrobacter agilis]TPV24855.1 carbohydrate ABC transporter substrate-binding protein [Arthrobacter agilis]VDR31007.1 Maltose-binding periplasmic proteins/domains [Arthrobacter agilis]